jgi:hypothetical protein
MAFLYEILSIEEIRLESIKVSSATFEVVAQASLTHSDARITRLIVGEGYV